MHTPNNSLDAKTSMAAQAKQPSLAGMLSRRSFLKTSATGVSACLLSQAGSGLPAQTNGPMFKAVIIGHTGHGNFGHDHDLIFNDRSNIELRAVADPDPTGRARAAKRSNAPRQYEDYRKMLAEEKPDLVCIAPRWTDQHHAMGRAALEAGAHLYLEKPFTQTLAEADDLLALAAKGSRQIVVAHQMRLSPSILHLKERILAGDLGEIISVHAHGKQDRRAGGEDLIVLGTHLFDMLRFLVGDPLWCTARIRQNGREVTKADVRQPTENVGPIIGDQIEAQFALANGAMLYYVSRADNRQNAGHWGFEIRGSKGTVRVLADIFPRAYWLPASDFGPAGKVDRWEPLPNDPSAAVPEGERGFYHANRRVVDDWLQAIATGQPGACSGLNAMKAIEMIMAIFQAGLDRQRVAFPLKTRTHPLAAR